MPSLRAKFFSAMIRLTVRRRRWGKDEAGLARTARRVFGAPKFLQWLSTIGVDVENGVRGEWLQTKNYNRTGVLFYIHGGGFVSCSPQTHRPITATLARKTRLAVFAPEYRLAPEYKYPAAIDDVVAAYEYVLREIDGPVAVAGDSAGGGLVLSLLIEARKRGLKMPACAVCISPWTDLTGSGDSVTTNAGRDAMFYPENMQEFAAGYLDNIAPDDARVSPALADHAGLCPLLFHVGSTELLLDDSRRIHEDILSKAGESELEIFDDVPHGWQMLNGFVPEAADSLEKAADFILRHIKPAM